ncbi:MAG: VOC family protein [Gemmatimonadota bacterium]|nr:VOC family protein [Gemmatimonadota bacterium]
MISGTHIVHFSEDAEADRAFLRDVLDLPSVDAGGGWLIFGLPPSELACHPADGRPATGGPIDAQVYLMTENLDATISTLGRHDVECEDPRDEGWGVLTSVLLPSGSRIGLYQPRRATALGL